MEKKQRFVQEFKVGVDGDYDGSGRVRERLGCDELCVKLLGLRFGSDTSWILNQGFD